MALYWHFGHLLTFLYYFVFYLGFFVCFRGNVSAPGARRANIPPQCPAMFFPLAAQTLYNLHQSCETLKTLANPPKSLHGLH